jgi:hypothetical protein
LSPDAIHILKEGTGEAVSPDLKKSSNTK